MPSNYRADIDGLRAIAIIPIVLFHAEVPCFSGGYVGVDVFFVISGYLIARIILDDLEKGNFSILTFYERRIRRIFPALFLVLTVTLCASLWMMFPSELMRYGKSLVAAAFFGSNYYFMLDTGYFSAPAASKPLLHLWSLAVEEQFYILLPIYLYIISYYYKRGMGLITVIIVLTLLFYSEVAVYLFPSDAFFSTLGRGWELMVGVALAVFPRKSLGSKGANVLTSSGLGLIAYAVFIYTNETVFPGVMALVPVVGAALIIYAGDVKGNIVGLLLSTKGLCFIGLLSYSLYLWHWPILVFYKIYAVASITHAETVFLICVIILVSYLSWRFIEQPFRGRGSLRNQKRVFLVGMIVMLFISLMGIIIFMGAGFPERYSARVKTLLAAETDVLNKKGCHMVRTELGASLRVCQLGELAEGSASFAVWGDSHGEAILPGIEKSAKEARVQGIFVGKGGCLPLISAQQTSREYENCIAIADAFIEYLSSHSEIKKVILVSRWAIYAMGDRYRGEKGHTVYIKDFHTDSPSRLENKRVFHRSMGRTLKRLSDLGLKIFIVTQVPETEWVVPRDTVRADIFKHSIDFRPQVGDYFGRQQFVTEVMEEYRGRYAVEFVHPYKEMCTKVFCWVYDEGVPIYRDSNHLTATYAKKISNVFDYIFEKDDE